METSFIRSLFGDKDGSVSSKRLVLFSLVFSFLTLVFVNLFTGKTVNDTLLSSLVTLIWPAMAAVFGEAVVGAFSPKSK